MTHRADGVTRPLNIAYVGLPRERAHRRAASHPELTDRGYGLMVCRMICDYFFPKVGGVESHIYSLAEALAKLDHKARAHPPRITQSISR